MLFAKVLFWDGTENGYSCASYRLTPNVVTLDVADPSKPTGLSPMSFRLAGNAGEQTIKSCDIVNAAGVPVKTVVGVQPKPSAPPPPVEAPPPVDE